MTHLDLWIGVPALLVCFEQVIFSILFLYSYGWGEYRSDYVQKNRRFTPFSAAAHAFNPADLLLGIWRAFELLPSLFGNARRSRSGNEIEFTSTNEDHRAAKLALTNANEQL